MKHVVFAAMLAALPSVGMADELVELISLAESGGDADATPAFLDLDVEVSALRVDELMALQAETADASAGLFQLSRPTILLLVENGVLDREEIFDEAAQRGSAMWLIDQCIAGAATVNDGVNCLGTTWASLPVTWWDQGARPRNAFGQAALVDLATMELAVAERMDASR